MGGFKGVVDAMRKQISQEALEEPSEDKAASARLEQAVASAEVAETNPTPELAQWLLFTSDHKHWSTDWKHTQTTLLLTLEN